MSKKMEHLSLRTQSMIEGRLVAGEEVLAVSRVSNGIYWKSIAVFVLGLLFAVFVAARLGALLFVVSALMFVYAYLRKNVLLCVLTTKRVMARAGIIKVDMVDIRFDKIESIELEQMLTGYAMGYANLVVTGTGNRYINVPYVANGVIVRRAFSEIVLGEE